MGAGVEQALGLVLVPFQAAIVIRPSLPRIFIIHIEVNEEVWLADTLPHIGDEGVVLCRLAHGVAACYKRLAQRAFARGARADNRNSQVTIT